MRLLKLLLLSLTVFSTIATVNAQDLHFTLFELTPTIINPAQTGAFRGTFRGGILYRSQWEATTFNNGYQTINAFVDSPILSVGKKKKDWLGIGMTFINDAVEGDLFTPEISNRTAGLVTNFMIPSAAYHKVLDKKGDHVLTFGVQGGVVTRRIGLNGLIFEEELQLGGNLGFGQGSDRMNLRGSNETSNLGEDLRQIQFTDISAGFLYRGNIDKDTKLELGFSLPHIITLNNYNLSRDTLNRNEDNSDNKRPRTFRVHGRLDKQINENVSIHPMVFFQTTKGLYEAVIQATAGYSFNKDLMVRAGLGFRAVNTQGTDALQGLVLAHYKDWLVGISRDFTVSQLQTQGRIGNGFEIGVHKIFKIYKDPVSNPKILCPEF